MPDHHPWPSEREIRLAQTSPRFDRDWSKFDFSECKHGLMIGVTPLGVGQPDWNVEICHFCGHVESQCNHNKFEWNETGSLLRCTTCGTDGT